MGLIDKLFKGKLRPVLAAHPEIGPVLHALITKLDVTAARALFTASHGRWHRRWLVVNAISEHYVAKLPDASRAKLMDGWVKSTPDEALAYLARALFHVEAAWQARGRGRAASVSSEGWRTFERHMKATAPDLERAAQLEPADPTPYFIMMGAAPGIRAGAAAKAVVVEHHQAVAARAPDHHIAHRRLVFLTSQRWFGSHGESLEHAKRLSARAADGSELPMLVFAAHEYARSYVHFFDKDIAGAVAYAQRPEVVHDIDTAYKRSLGSPRHQPTDLTPYRRHEAALWFWATGDKARCRVELEKVGDLFDEKDDPWHLTATRYRAIRKELGL